MGLDRKLTHLLRPEEPEKRAEYRRRIEWLMLLRLVIMTALLGITVFFQLHTIGDPFFNSAVPLYVLIGTTFFLSLIYAFALPLVPNLYVFSFVQLVLDVFYATVVIHFTGGASSAFTVLYIFAITASGILHFRRGSLIIAAISSILFGTLINLEFYQLVPQTYWPWISFWSRETPGYILWVLIVHITFFFLVAVVSSTLAEQLQRTKATLSSKEIDFKTLSRLHSSIVRSISSGILTTDGLNRITFVNDAGLNLLGTDFNEIGFQPVKNVFPILDNDQNPENPKTSFLTLIDVNNESKNFELSISNLHDEKLSNTGRLIVFNDVTQLRKMEERVKQSEKQAAFVRIAAGMAHEIRNPLAALRGAAELISQTSSEDLNQRLSGIITRESDRLNNLLGDFLLTVGNHKLNRSTIMLGDLVEETVELFSKEPRVNKHCQIETFINKGIEIQGDPVRLKQALWNLLTNALDAGDPGARIRITLETDTENKLAVLKVQDWGSGIPYEIRNRLFEPFTTTKDKGTGLGLAVVMGIAESHGGSIDVDSSPEGTTFTMTLPLHISDPN